MPILALRAQGLEVMIVKSEEMTLEGLKHAYATLHRLPSNA